MSASDWSANSGWRSQIETTSSIGASGPGCRLLDTGGGADRDQAGVASRLAQRGAQGQPPAERVADQQCALARGGDLREPALERVLALLQQHRRLVEPLGYRRPSAGGLHEAGDEQDGRWHRPEWWRSG